MNRPIYNPDLSLHSNPPGGYPTRFPPQNYQATFNGYDLKTPFQNHDFVNKGTLINNDLKDIVLNEEIREYSIMIDSKDRNYQVYKDPFRYDVRFNPMPRSYSQENGVTIQHEEPNPTINEKFSNVRYIKLEKMVLPYFNKVKSKFDYDGDLELDKRWVVDTYHPLTDNMYLVLSLGPNFADANYRSTNDVLSDSFAVIYFDAKANQTHYFGNTSNGIKVFPKDQLGKIDKLRISFYDPYGQPIQCPHLDSRIQSNMECHCEDPTGDDNTDCYKHNLFHPLNPIFQHHLHFKVGVVEPRLNTKIFH